MAMSCAQGTITVWDALLSADDIDVNAGVFHASTSSRSGSDFQVSVSAWVNGEGGLGLSLFTRWRR